MSINLSVSWSNRNYLHQIIPEDRLYKALYVNGVPTDIDVSVGIVDARRSEAYGNYLTAVNAGVERFFYIQAKDQAGNNINTNTDSFEVRFLHSTIYVHYTSTTAPTC